MEFPNGFLQYLTTLSCMSVKYMKISLSGPIHTTHLQPASLADHVHLAPGVGQVERARGLQHGREVGVEAREEAVKTHEQHLARGEVHGLLVHRLPL